MKLSTMRAHAEALLGTIEDPSPPYPPNHCIISELCDHTWWLGFSRQNAQWCGTFVDYVLGQELLPGPCYTVTTGLGHFKQDGRFSPTPKPGYVAFMSFRADRLASHVGIVMDVISDTLVDNIEGNTSPGYAGVQDNGGGVFRRTRTGGILLGYGVVEYEPEGELEVLDHLIKADAYKNIFGVWSTGVIRAMYGDEEYVKYVNSGVPLKVVRSDEIKKALELAGPASGPLESA